MRVLRISASDAKYGGNIYEGLIDNLINHDVDVFYSLRFIPKKFRYIFVPFFYILNFIKSHFNSASVVILPMEALSFLSKKKKNIVIVHHVDHSYSSFLSAINQIFTFKLLMLNKSRIHKIVVVSNFWKDYLVGLGFDNVEIIYNSVDSSIQEVEKTSNSTFVKPGKINIYIGNYHIKKGTLDLINFLKKNDKFVLHTSGYPGEDIPNVINHSRLQYCDYLRLLKEVDVCITFSKFREGWCRTAHESLILGTCVIGSGFGGMGELLFNSKQLIVNHIDDLSFHLDNLIKSPVEIDMEYVLSFSHFRFSDSWNKLLESL